MKQVEYWNGVAIARCHAWWAVVLFVAMPAVALEEFEIENEITRTKRELERVEEERSRVRENVGRDAREFQEYRTRTRDRFARIAAETDSVRREIRTFAGRSDSLSAVLNAIAGRKREYELRQNALRNALVELCDRLVTTADRLPPSSHQTATSISFLRSELTTNRIDNSEGMHRIVQILDEMDNQLMEIQITQGTSPLAEIPGTIYRLRIGGVFEALVDEKGRKCALWSPGRPDPWVVVDEPAAASLVLKAVNVREGKALPSLVSLPYTGSPAKGGSDE